MRSKIIQLIQVGSYMVALREDGTIWRCDPLETENGCCFKWVFVEQVIDLPKE